MESKCHVANTCIYEVPGSRVDVRYHRISYMLEKLILPLPDIPECVPVKYGFKSESLDDDSEICQDCAIWEFI